MTMPDVNFNDGLVTVRRGKGGNARVAPFGPQTSAVLDRYVHVAPREY